MWACVLGVTHTAHELGKQPEINSGVVSQHLIILESIPRLGADVFHAFNP